MIDDVVADDDIIMYFSYLYIGMFDKCLADVHCPLTFVLDYNNSPGKMTENNILKLNMEGETYKIWLVNKKGWRI